MSQAGEIDVTATHPEIPTEFVANVGIAVPIANILEILGDTTAAGTVPVHTTGSGNTITTLVQISQAIALTNAANIGLSAFDSGFFTVDANGFVSLMGGAVSQSFDVDAHTAPGTDPVVPSGLGVIIVTGGQVAAGTTANVLQTNSLAANTYTIQVQRSSAQAASTIGSNGVSHFNSAEFAVDANGFVSLLGAGEAIDSIAVQTGTSPIVPTVGGLVTINGAVVSSGTNPIRTNGTGANTMAVEVQISQAIAAADATKIGLANFSSTDFAVAATGFVTLSTTGAGKTITGNSGGALSPTANNWNIFGASTAAGTSPVSTSGAVSTLTVNVQKSQAIASTDATKVGLSAFDSAAFTVDANGFVSLLGAGEAIDSIAVQTGTSPIVPTVAGLVTINGSVVAAGTNPIRSNGTDANTMAMQVQISQALSATDATKIGLSNFDSAAFDVDANGFVQLNGGGIAATIFDVQANTAPGTDPVVPTAAGVVTVNGAAVANHSVVLETRSRAANAYNLEVQYATSAAATDATKSGVAHFNSTQFSVDANGFVTLAGGTEAIDSIGVDATSGAGTNPVLPTVAGLVTVNGARVAAGTNPIRSVSTAANVYQIQVQTSQALAATDATKVGLANFDSASFGVDANGFVTMTGGGGFTWNDVSGAFSPLKNNGYFITGTATGTLPAAPSQGDTIKFFVDHASQVLTIQATAGKIIRFGSLVSSSGGTFVSTLQGDSVELTYRTSDTCWCAIAGYTGTWTLT